MRQRFLALGDSYTIGEGVKESERWPAQLARALRAMQLDVADPEIIATTGWTTDELARAMERAAPQPPFALVTLLVGVNDQYRGCDPERYAFRFRSLLERAVRLASGVASRVVVVSVPDWSVTPFAVNDARPARTIAAEIDRFNAIAQSEAERAGARFVNITPVSRAAVTDRALLASDDLHPSGAMYARWIEVLLPAATRALDGDS